MAKFGALAIALLAAIALAIFATTPPSPKGANAPADEFSAMRAMDDIRVIAAAPHPTGSAENLAVRDFLVERLGSMGLSVEIKEGEIDGRSAGRLTTFLGKDAAGIRINNIVATLPGSDASKAAVLVMAHYDSVGGSPGAADDASGVAAILEIVRAIQARGQAQREIIVLFTDGEELGLVGARQFFASNPLRERVGAVINLESRGGGGRASLFETSTENGEAVRVYAENVSRPAASSLSVFVYRLLPNDTDLTPALERDYAAYNFAFIGRPGLYHSPKATPANLDQGAVQDLGAQGLGLTSALVFADELPAKSADVSFFDLFGMAMVVFPPWWGWAILGVAGMALSLSVFRSFAARDFLIGIGRWAVLTFSCGLVIFGLNQLSGNRGGELAYYDRLAALPMLEVMAGLVAGASFLFVLRNSGKQSASDVAGFAFPLFALAVAMQWFAPTAAYMLIFPLLLTSIAHLAVNRIDGIAGLAIATLVAAVVAGLQLVNFHQLMQGVGADVPMVIALPLGIAAVAILPVWPKGRLDHAAWGVAAMLALALAISFWVRFDPVADTVATYATP